ncbi:hypothetical protein TSUD_174860 [Trifolium subterraneum]|uniref:Uncharacterized protein n=1 Tax=Trifolium subterraneum TaxID=3900 RepID=A0A2Z6NVN6_TRISU|nr:hypothetical protein TSUD_174860 [Trifolium subterraneum]
MRKERIERESLNQKIGPHEHGLYKAGKEGDHLTAEMEETIEIVDSITENKGGVCLARAFILNLV